MSNTMLAPSVRTCGDPAASFVGHLHLTAARRLNGQTAIAHQSFRAPFHLSKPYWDGRVLQVQIVNSTAGILEGDQLELDVRVESGAALLVTTPAAARAFMMRTGLAACRQRFTVADGAWLEYSPEPLCPHRGCDYTQSTCVNLAPDAELFYVDTLAPGRVGRGEVWAWRRLRLALQVDRANEPLLRERLDHSGEAMARSACFHGTPHAWMATVVIVSSRIAPDDPLWDHVRALHTGESWCGVSRLRAAGWVIRILVSNGQALRDCLRELRTLLAGHLPQLAGDARKL